MDATLPTISLPVAINQWCRKRPGLRTPIKQAPRWPSVGGGMALNIMWTWNPSSIVYSVTYQMSTEIKLMTFSILRGQEVESRNGSECGANESVQVTIYPKGGKKWIREDKTQEESIQFTKKHSINGSNRNTKILSIHSYINITTKINLPHMSK